MYISVLGLRAGTSVAKYIRENKSTRAYRIKGVFGLATDNFYKDGAVIEKTTYKYVKQIHLDKLLSHLQAMHQKKMFEYVYILRNLFCLPNFEFIGFVG